MHIPGLRVFENITVIVGCRTYICFTMHLIYISPSSVICTAFQSYAEAHATEIHHGID